MKAAREGREAAAWHAVTRLRERAREDRGSAQALALTLDEGGLARERRLAIATKPSHT